MELLARARVLISRSPLSILPITTEMKSHTGSWLGVTEHEQIIYDDAQPNATLHAALMASMSGAVNHGSLKSSARRDY